MFFTMGLQFFFAAFALWAENDACADALIKDLIRYANHGHLMHGSMLREYIFNLFGADPM